MGKKHKILKTMAELRLYRKLLPICLLVSSLALVAYIAVDKEQQWDFKTYYYAFKAFNSGLSPYDNNVLSQLAKEKIHLNFVYPPITLFFFRPFSLVNYGTAFYMFLALKCVLLTLLLYIWKKTFLRENDPLFYLFCFLGFNAAVILDLRAGNVSIIEQVLLWTGFIFYLKRRIFLFCLCVISAALFKITPILFLFLLLISKEKYRYAYFFAASIIFFVILFVSYISMPDLWHELLRNLQRLDAKGIPSPSTYALVRAVLRYFGRQVHVVVSRPLLMAVYLFIDAAVVFFSWKAYNALRLVDKEDKIKMLLYFACFVYVLIIPRVKVYSYIVLIIPAYFVIQRVSRAAGRFLLFAMTIFPALYITEYFIVTNRTANALLRYYPLLVAYALWWVFVNESIRPQYRHKKC